MSQNEQLSLSWDAHQKSICSGLSVLQQRGEFVDMTLAADGHHVKVHQMVLSLVSPYIKELISSAQCPHPVIFLNNISYTTLCSLLEYIYTGEMLVPRDRLGALIAAGKALHIRGLKEMDYQEHASAVNENTSINNRVNEKFNTLRNTENAELETDNMDCEEPAPMCKVYVNDNGDMDENITVTTTDNPVESTSESPRKPSMYQKVQYTVSNHGRLQAVHNRYLYRLRYYRKKDGTRTWRCVDYEKSHLRCPANICTNDKNQITERTFKHNHPFHDNRILKKVRSGLIYTVFQEAAHSATGKLRQQNSSVSKDNINEND